MLLVQFLVFFSEFLLVLLGKRLGTGTEVRKCPHGEEKSGGRPSQYGIARPFCKFAEIVG